MGGRGASSSKGTSGIKGGAGWSRVKKIEVLGKDGKYPSITKGEDRIIQIGEKFIVNIKRNGVTRAYDGGNSLERAKEIINTWDNPTKKWQAVPGEEGLFETGKAGVGNGRFSISETKDGKFMVHQQKEKMLQLIGREKTLKDAKSFVEVYDKFGQK